MYLLYIENYSISENLQINYYKLNISSEIDGHIKSLLITYSRARAVENFIIKNRAISMTDRAKDFE